MFLKFFVKLSQMWHAFSSMVIIFKPALMRESVLGLVFSIIMAALLLPSFTVAYY